MNNVRPPCREGPRDKTPNRTGIYTHSVYKQTPNRSGERRAGTKHLSHRLFPSKHLQVTDAQSQSVAEGQTHKRDVCITHPGSSCPFSLLPLSRAHHL